jgi:two-component system sensor histidine kinase DesK
VEHVDRPSVSRAWLFAGCVIVVLVLALLALGQDAPYLAIAISTIVASAVGVTTSALLRSRQARRAYEQELSRWAADSAVHAERLRIARDLHDLASHGLGLMTVRAAAANLVDDGSGDAERRQALKDIERLSRETTADLRSMLALLRSGADSPAPLRPVASLSDVPRIVSDARAAGLDVAFDLRDLGQTSPAVQLTVCAVVREGLTNTLRHAGPTHARITIERRAAGIDVEVQDGGPVPGWSPRPGTGTGLRGLQERLAVHRGTLDAAQGTAGFRVLAHIPEESA